MLSIGRIWISYFDLEFPFFFPFDPTDQLENLAILLQCHSSLHNAINGSSGAESRDPLFSLDILLSFFFSKPTVFSFIGENSPAIKDLFGSPAYIEKASSVHSSVTANTFNYPFRGSPTGHHGGVAFKTRTVSRASRSCDPSPPPPPLLTRFRGSVLFTQHFYIFAILFSPPPFFS